MRPIRVLPLVPAVLLSLTAHASAQRGDAKPKLTAPGRTAPAAEPAAERGRAVPVAGLRGAPSSATENEADEADPPFDFRARLSGRAAPSDAPLASAGATASAPVLLRLVDHPRAAELARWLADSLRGREIDVALLGGQKYMINDCLGIKASAGTFRLKLEDPEVRFEDTGIVLRLSIERVSMSALKIRMRPNPNLLEPCKFSKKFEVGGNMDDVRFTLRFDPFYDLERCRIGRWNDLNPEVRIGNLNLKPLQNDLDRMAKNMVEDALTFALTMSVDGVLSALGELTLSAIDQFLEADCPTSQGDVARAAKSVAGALGGAASAADEGSGRSASGASATAGRAPGAGAPADVEALLARIAALEARIAELEASGGASADLPVLLREVIARLGPLEAGSVGPEASELLVQLLALAFERSARGDPRALIDELARRAGIADAARPDPAGPAGASEPPAPWFLVPNPALKGRMGRIVVRFPDTELAKGTLVALHLDGKKVADRYGEAAWELLPGVHDVHVSNAVVRGCEVRSGHDTVVRAGLLAVELDAGTHFAVFPRGGETKLTDHYGSAAIGLPIGDYDVEIHGQRALVTVREGEVTRF